MLFWGDVDDVDDGRSRSNCFALLKGGGREGGHGNGFVLEPSVTIGPRLFSNLPQKEEIKCNLRYRRNREPPIVPASNGRLQE